MAMHPRRRVRMVPGSVVVDGREVHYALSDNECIPFDGAPSPVWAVNVHGYFAGGGMYWRESARLAAGLGWRVVNPSLPGFGGSDPLPWDDLSMRGLAETLGGLLDALDAGPVVVFGHSMGGAVAIQFAHDHPERTLGVVYRDGAATASWKERRGIVAQVLRPLSPDLGAMADLLAAVAVDVPDFLVGRLGSTLRGVMPDVRRNLSSVADALPVAAMLFGSDLTAEVENVARRQQVPLFPLWGRFDRITPARTAAEFERVSGVEVQWVRGGHSWMIARPATQGNLLVRSALGRQFVRDVVARAEQVRSGGRPAEVLPLLTRLADAPALGRG